MCAQYVHVVRNGLVTIAMDASEEGQSEFNSKYINVRQRTTVLMKDPHAEAGVDGINDLVKDPHADAGVNGIDPVHIMCAYEAGTGVCIKRSEEEKTFLKLLKLPVRLARGTSLPEGRLVPADGSRVQCVTRV
jgi:hypothetical protein